MEGEIDDDDDDENWVKYQTEEEEDKDLLHGDPVGEFQK